MTDDDLSIRVIPKRDDDEILDAVTVSRASVAAEYECKAFSTAPFIVAEGCNPCEVCGEGARCAGNLKKLRDVLLLKLGDTPE